MKFSRVVRASDSPNGTRFSCCHFRAARIKIITSRAIYTTGSYHASLWPFPLVHVVFLVQCTLYSTTVQCTVKYTQYYSVYLLFAPLVCCIESEVFLLSIGFSIVNSYAVLRGYFVYSWNQQIRKVFDKNRLANAPPVIVIYLPWCLFYLLRRQSVDK